MLLVTLCLFVFVFEAEACETSTFKNTRATVSGKSNENPADIALNDCLENNAETRNYFTIEVKNQNVEKLKRGAFVNLPVVKLTLQNNRIRDIEKNSFENLKSLQTLDLSKNKVRSIFKDVFNNLISMKILDLSQNEIEQIEDQAFAYLVSLEELNFSLNKIKVWNPNWFSGNIALKKINAGGNYLETLPEHSFKDMDQLDALILRENNLRELHQNTFRGLKSLKELDISVNKLTKLHKDTFMPFNGRIGDHIQGPHSRTDAIFFEAFSGLRSLYVHTNNITYLPDKIMDDLSNTRSFIFFTFHSNPWQCGCYLKILDWADSRRIRTNIMGKGCYRKDNPVCVVPTENPKGCIEDVQEDIRSLYYEKFQTPIYDFFDRNLVCKDF